MKHTINRIDLVDIYKTLHSRIIENSSPKIGSTNLKILKS